jgi:hypothetical protein
MSAKKPIKLSVSDFIGTKKQGLVGQTSPSKILEDDLLVFQEFDRDNLPYNEIETNEYEKDTNGDIILDKKGNPIPVKKQIPFLLVSINGGEYQQFRITPRWMVCLIKSIDFESLDYQASFTQKAIIKGKDAFSIQYEFLNV